MNHFVQGEAIIEHSPSRKIPVFQKADRNRDLSGSAFQSRLKKEHVSSISMNFNIVPSPTLVSTFHTDPNTRGVSNTFQARSLPHPILDHRPSNQNVYMSDLMLTPSVEVYPRHDEYNMMFNDRSYSEEKEIPKAEMTLTEYSMFLWNRTSHFSLPMDTSSFKDNHFVIGFKPIVSDEIMDETTIVRSHENLPESSSRICSSSSSSRRITTPSSSLHEPTSPPMLKRHTKLEAVAICPSMNVAIEKKLSIDFILFGNDYQSNIAKDE
jgi:hypothetical protein